MIDGVSDTATLAGAVKKAREKNPNSNTVLGTYTPEELLKKLYMMLPASEFIKDGETDQEALKEFLDQAKAKRSRLRIRSCKTMTEAFSGGKRTGWRRRKGSFRLTPPP